MSGARFIIGDTRQVVASLPDGSVDLVMTSPPFLALRSYLPADHPDKALEIGQEPDPAAFIDMLLALTAEWGRVLVPHGSIAVELGDTYSGHDNRGSTAEDKSRNGVHTKIGAVKTGPGWPLAKSLALIPELYRIGLAYGVNPLTGAESPAGRWRVRNVVRWCRPNPPVGALGDKYRPSTSDMVIACRSPKRWFDLDAVRTELTAPDKTQVVAGARIDPSRHGEREVAGRVMEQNPAGAPPLDHWIISTAPYKGAHYATYPPELCRIPIESMCPRQVCTACGEPRRRVVGELTSREVSEDHAGKDRVQGREGGTFAKSHTVTLRETETLGWTDCGCGAPFRPGVVLDPFGGSGTTGQVAVGHGRDAILIDLDERNADLARERIGMFVTVEHGATA